MTETERFLEPLTPQQRFVTEQAIYGGSIAEIALVLGMAEGTIQRHLSKAYERLQVMSRAELIALYWQHRVRDAEDRAGEQRLRDALVGLLPLAAGNELALDRIHAALDGALA